MGVSHFPFWSFFRHISSPTVYISLILTFFSVSHHIAGPTMCVSHFARFSVFLDIFLCLSVCFSFSMIFKFHAIFKTLQWAFPIFHPFQCFSPYSRSYRVCVSFCTFFSFLIKIQVLLIFHVFHFFSPYSRSYSVCFSFCMFFSISRHISCPTMGVSHFPRLSVFSPYSRSYRVHFSFFTFSVFSAIFQALKCVFLIFHDLKFSCHTTGPTMCISYFPRF